MSAHNYELMFIADPEMDDNGLKKLTDQHTSSTDSSNSTSR